MDGNYVGHYRKDTLRGAGCIFSGRDCDRIDKGNHTYDNIINNLKERQTGIPVEKRRNVSPILAVGMLLNGLAIAIQESVSGNVKIAVQILAIIFMLMGLWDIFRKNH